MWSGNSSARGDRASFIKQIAQNAFWWTEWDPQPEVGCWREIARETERERERERERAKERESEREKERKRKERVLPRRIGRAAPPHLGHAFPMHLVLLVEHSSARGGLIRGIRVDCFHLGAVFVADRVTNEPPILLELYRGANDGADA